MHKKSHMAIIDDQCNKHYLLKEEWSMEKLESTVFKQLSKKEKPPKYEPPKFEQDWEEVIDRFPALIVAGVIKRR